MTLGEMAKQARIKKKMTQLELSRKLGYDTQQFISLFERDIGKVPLNVLGKLTVYLGMSEKSIIKKLTDEYAAKVAQALDEGKKEATNG